MASIYELNNRAVNEGDILEGRYRIGKVIGAGAYGKIFAAIDEQTGEQVAVKAIVPATSGTSRTAVGRFQREMKVIRNLIHPNIIAIYDWGETLESVTFMVLEYVDGETLDVTVRHKPMTVKVAIDVTRQITKALQIAHSAGVIHRDLKPANVMLSPTPTGSYHAKVLDFGMAKVLSRIEDESVVELTREGIAVGTPRYIAPEQARGLTVGPPADLYALGLLFYEMLTGFQAVKADTVEGAVTAHVSAEPLELKEIDTIPAPVHPLLFKMLEKDAGRRFQDAGELLAALDRLEVQLRPGRVISDDAVAGPPMGDVTGDFPGAVPLAVQQASAGPSSGQLLGQQLVERAQQRQQDISLELDYSAYDQHARREMDPVRRKRLAWTGRWLRLPRTPGEGAETALALVLMPVAFLLITAHLPHQESWIRLTIGAVAPCAALIASVLAHTDNWRFSFWRFLWTLSLGVIIIAHLLGPQQLATELLRNPTWFVSPGSEAPGAAQIAAVAEWFSKHYASLLSRFIVPIYGAQPPV
ncbi:MAG: serine/threonine protein kinase [Bradymonadaceae bacterium]|nr:serine/threonine protein kinase [Lujinxingiaceae bacterium]